MYSPRGVGFAPGIVVVHGMHELGINEPRLVAFARSLAASGFFVMTPQVQGIADYRVEAESAAVIGTAAQFFAQQLDVPKVGVLGISFSGGLALVGGNRSAVQQFDRMGRDGWGVLRSGACTAFFRDRRSRAPRRKLRESTPHEYGPLIVVLDGPAISSLRRMPPKPPRRSSWSWLTKAKSRRR